MEVPGNDPLLARLADGDQRAFAKLYDRFGQQLLRAAMGMLGSRQDAEDTVQEVFTAVWKSRQCLNNSQDLTAYLFTVLRRAAGRIAIRRARAPRLSETAIHQTPTTLNQHECDANPYSDELQRALLALPTEQREVVALKIDGHLTFAQIAKVMEISVNTAASRYRYALEKLRVSLKGSV